MTFSQEINNEVLRINLTGDLIGENNGPEILEVADAAIEKGVQACLIDITDVRYINSSGVGVLITLLTKFRNKGGDMVLMNPSEHVNKLLIIIKLRNIFNIALNEREALELIK